MKIDFDASYREIAGLVNSSAQSNGIAKKGESVFGELLRSISPDAPKITENAQNLQNNAASLIASDQTQELENEAMASLNLPTPEQLMPDFEALSLPLDEKENSAKSLSVVEVRRIRSNRQISRLQKAERMKVMQPLIKEAGFKQGVDPVLGMAVASAESSFNPMAVSRDGHNSKGVFQLLDSTGLDMKKRLGINDNYDPFDPKQNINFGVAYLRYLHEIFSNATNLPGGLQTVPAANSASLEKLAVAAFNAGEGRVAAAQKRATRAGYDPSDYLQVEAYLPESTRKYVKRVIASKTSFEGNFEG